MTPKSAKAKGRRLQQEVAAAICGRFGLGSDHARPAIMGESGADVKLSDVAKVFFPFAIECKNQESLSIWAALAQAERHATNINIAPLLVFRRNHGATWACLPFYVLLEMVGRKKEA